MESVAAQDASSNLACGWLRAMGFFSLFRKRTAKEGGEALESSGPQRNSDAR